MFTKLATAGVAALALVLAAAQFNTASAQYPPPGGNCVLTIEATQVAVGGSANMKVTVRDLNGNPLPNATVNVSVTSQPGSDASVSTSGPTTDANGELAGTVHVGSTAGVVQVGATAQQGAACNAQLQVGQGLVSPEVALPSTGAGTGEAGGVSGLLVLLLAAGGVASLAAGAAARRVARG